MPQPFLLFTILFFFSFFSLLHERQFLIMNQIWIGPKFSFLKAFGGFLSPLMQGVSMKSDICKKKQNANLMLQLLRILSHIQPHSNENAVIMSTILFYILLLSFLFFYFFKKQDCLVASYLLIELQCSTTHKRHFLIVLTKLISYF